MTIQTVPKGGSWRAWHIFGAYGDLDRILLEVVLPEVRALGDGCKFFFIRYGEGGPHIRARFLLDDRSFIALGERLRCRAERVVTSLSSPPGKKPSPIEITGKQFPQRMPPGQTVEIAYEPELVRYGGVAALAVNEHLFEESSRLALAIVDKTASALDRRTFVALSLTAAAIAHVAASRQAQLAFALMMQRFWQPYIPDVPASKQQARLALRSASPQLRAVLQVESGSTSPLPLVERWRTTLAAHFTQMRALSQNGSLILPLTGMPTKNLEEIEEALRSIMHSQIHMLNNRLGVTPQQEFFFATLLTMVLSSEETGPAL